MKKLMKLVPVLGVALFVGQSALAAEATVKVEDLTLVGEQITGSSAAAPNAYSHYSGYHGGYGHGGYSHGGYSHGGYSHGGYSYGGYSHGGYSYGGYSQHHGSYSYGGPHAHHSFHSHDHYHSGHFHSHDHYHSHWGFNRAAGNVDLLPNVNVDLKS